MRHRTEELAAAVYDAVADGICRAEFEKSAAHSLNVSDAAGRRQIRRTGEPIGAIEQAQLETARPRIDHQDAQPAGSSPIANVVALPSVTRPRPLLDLGIVLAMVARVGAGQEAAVGHLLA